MLKRELFDGVLAEFAVFAKCLLGSATFILNKVD